MIIRIIYLIFVLAYAGGGTSCNFRDPLITISDANPIQFWINGVETFNQKEVCSIAPICFCQKFECNDSIRIQLSDDNYAKGYKIKILNDVGSTILTDDFFRRLIYATEISNLQFSDYNPLGQTGFLAPWANGQSGAGQVGFAWTGTNTIKADASISHEANTGVLYQGRAAFSALGYPPGAYSITITANNQSSTAGASAPLESLLTIYGSDTGAAFSFTNLGATGTNTYPAAAQTSRTLTFTTTKYWKYIGFQWSKSGSSSNYYVVLTVNSIVINSAPGFDVSSAVYDYSFVPSAHGICNDQYQIEILDNADNSIVAYSDCISVKTSQDCTELITYYNSNNFADLDYSDESPSIVFYLRVDAVFFEEVYPEEMESIDLSDSQSVQLRSEVKRKKTLVLGYMPFYMHRKLQLVLAHDNVTIDGESWMKLDGYQITAGDKHYPLRKAQSLLTDKNYIQRNVL